MANGSSGYRPQTSNNFIPKLQLDILPSPNGSLTSQLTHGHSGDPNVNGWYDWTDPQILVYGRDITPEFLALNPVIVMERLKLRKKRINDRERKSKGWVIPGNTSNNGLQYNGGNSSTNEYGITPSEISNFFPISSFLGYDRNSAISVPVSRFTNDVIGANYLTQIQRAVRVEDWRNDISFSGYKRNMNSSMKFRFTFAIENPTWSATNHQNKYIFGDGVTLKVFPRLQTFNDGGITEYYIGWQTQVKE